MQIEVDLGNTIARHDLSADETQLWIQVLSLELKRLQTLGPNDPTLYTTRAKQAGHLADIAITEMIRRGIKESK